MIARALAALLVVLAVLPAASQQRSQRTAPPPAPAAPPPPPPGPTYEPMLLRLSEILGAVTFLTELCQDAAQPGQSSAVFRNRMKALLDSEGQAEVLRDRLAGSYNRGFTGYRYSHRRCLPASRVALERLMSEGAKLSHEITARFGS